MVLSASCLQLHFTGKVLQKEPKGQQLLISSPFTAKHLKKLPLFPISLSEEFWSSSSKSCDESSSLGALIEWRGLNPSRLGAAAASMFFLSEGSGLPSSSGLGSAFAACAELYLLCLDTFHT